MPKELDVCIELSKHALVKGRQAGSFITVLSRAFNMPVSLILHKKGVIYTVFLTCLTTDPHPPWNTLWEMLSWRTS